MAYEMAKSRSDVLYAAFDADGTLWDTDLGENFFQWQIANSGLKLPPNPWKHYRDWKNSGDPRPAYLWLAQINADQKIETVRDWAEQAVKDLGTIPIFSEQQKLIHWLQSKNVEIYIVTASVKWAVEPGAQRLGIPFDHVLGVATKIHAGLVTNDQDGLITYREGKLQSLLEKTKGQKPFLSCGNTMGDIALLEGATELALCVGAATKDSELFPAEEKLREAAATKPWLVHRF